MEISLLIYNIYNERLSKSYRFLVILSTRFLLESSITLTKTYQEYKERNISFSSAQISHSTTISTFFLLLKPLIAFLFFYRFSLCFSIIHLLIIIFLSTSVIFSLSLVKAFAGSLLTRISFLLLCIPPFGYTVISSE